MFAGSGRSGIVGARRILSEEFSALIGDAQSLDSRPADTPAGLNQSLALGENQFSRHQLVECWFNRSILKSAVHPVPCSANCLSDIPIAFAYGLVKSLQDSAQDVGVHG